MMSPDRSKHWRNLGLALGGVAGLLAFVACGVSSDSDSAAGMEAGAAGSSSSPDAGQDSYAGMGGSGGFGGSGGMGGSGGTSGAGGQGPASLFRATPTAYLVNASPELFPFRICVDGAGTFATHYPYPDDSAHHLPQTNYPGIATGGAVDLSPVLDLVGSQTVTLYAVRANNSHVARATPDHDENDEYNCSSLLSGFNEIPDEDILVFENVELPDPEIAPIRLLVISGCRATDENYPAALCGDGYDYTQSNLTAEVLGFDPALTMEPNTTRVFASHLSPYLESLEPEHSLELSYGNLESDDGRTSISSDIPSGVPTMDPGEFTPPASLKEYAQKGFKLVAKKSAGEHQTLLEASLADIQRVSSRYETPDMFYPGSNGLVLLFLGDASVVNDAPLTEPWLLDDGSWNPAYDGTGLHAVAIPFDFEYVE